MSNKFHHGIKAILAISLLVGVLTVVIPPRHASAAYDGGLIIDDGTFLNSSAMNQSAVQDFLTSKGSGLASKTFTFDCASTGASNTYYVNAGAPCGQTVQASVIIYYASQIYGMNPQVVLATLQKEQSLVTNPSPADWAINQAMGYGCPDSGGCGASNFLYQIDNGVWLLRFHMERARGNMSYWFTSTSWVCGTAKNYYKPNLYPKQNVNFYDDNGVLYRTHYISSASTSSLYCYTPHAYNNPQGLYGLPAYGTSGQYYSGSYNFVTYFERWFGSTISGVKLSPLFKSIETQQIFAIFGSKKYLLSSPEVMTSYGLDRYPVVDVSNSFLANYTTGVAITTSIAKKEIDPSGTIYFFDGGKRYPITLSSCKTDPTGVPVTNTTWGLDCFNGATTLSLPNELIDNFTAEDIPLSPIALNNGTAWLMDGGKKRRITSPIIVDQKGGWGNAKWMQDYHMNQVEGKIAIPNLSVVKFDDTPQLYMFYNDQLYGIPSMEEYYSWKLNLVSSLNLPAVINRVDPLTVSSKPLSVFAQDQNGSNYLLLANGKKALLGVGATIQPTSDIITRVSNDILDRLSTTTLSNVFRATNGDIFTVVNNIKYVFPTANDLFYSGHAQDELQPVTVSVSSALTYGGGQLSRGRLIKVIGDDTIRYIYADGASLAVYSSNIPGLPYDKLITVDAKTGSRYPIVGVYH